MKIWLKSVVTGTESWRLQYDKAAEHAMRNLQAHHAPRKHGRQNKTSGQSWFLSLSHSAPRAFVQLCYRMWTRVSSPSSRPSETAGSSQLFPEKRIEYHDNARSSTAPCIEEFLEKKKYQSWYWNTLLIRPISLWNFLPTSRFNGSHFETRKRLRRSTNVAISVG